MYSLYQTLSEIQTYREEHMQEILTELTTTISEFKKNPNLEVARSKGQPFAVLTNNKPSFYVLSPELFDTLMERLWEQDQAPEILRRKSEAIERVKVTLVQDS